MSDDHALVEAARAGDPAALAALLTRYEPAIYRFGLQLCRDPEAARDVLQETLLAATRGVEGYRGEASVGTWLYTIARSFCIKRRRRGRSVAAGASLDDEGDPAVSTLAAPGTAPDEALAAREQARALDAALAALAPAHREVLLLRDVEGLTAPEVAEVTGLSVEAVKSRLHRARAELRRRLAPLFAPEPRSERAGAAPCPDVVRLFSQKLEGEIAPALCAEMERHLASCGRCRARCDALRAALAGCRAMPAEVPPDLQAAVRALLARALGVRATEGPGVRAR